MKKYAKLMGLFAVLIVVIGIGYQFKQPKHSRTTVVSDPQVVRLSAVLQQAVPERVVAVATLAANQQAVITSKVSGYLSQIGFQDGQFVTQGMTLFKLDDATQRQAYLADQAKTQLARVTAQRYQKLIKLNAASKQQIDQYQSEYLQAMAQQKADEVSLQDLTLRAPIKGYVSTTSYNVGDYVSAGTALVNVTDSDVLKVKYSVPSFFSPKLKLGQVVTLEAKFLPKKVFVGQVTYIAPTVDENTQTIDVHARIENKAHLLKPGQTVTVTQELGVKPQQILVPSEAVITSVDGSHVLTVKQGVVVSVPVTLGQRYHKMIVVTNGLAAHSKIMTEGQFQVKPGQQVTVVK